MTLSQNSRLPTGNKTKQKKTTTKGHGSTLEEMRPNHAISSAVTSTKLPLCRVILKRRRRTTTTKMRNVVFFENSSTLEFLSFWLSYGT